MGLLATVLGALGVSEAAGLVAPVLNRADHLLFDRFGSEALKDIQARLSGVLTDIPPNHDLENAIRLAGVTAGLILLQQVRSELEADQLDTRSAQPLPPFLDEARRWLHGQLAIGAMLNGQTNATLLHELERGLDAVLAARTPDTVRESLTDAETTMWEALIGSMAAQGGGAPPDGFADRFHGRVTGKPGWTIILHALLREALRSDPDARITFLTTRLGTLSTAMPSLMKKIDTIGERIDALNVKIERRDREAVAEREQQAQEANHQHQKTNLKLDNQAAQLSELLTLVRAGGVFARAAEQGISEAAVRGIVERLGGQNIAPDDLIPWLDNWIEHARVELDRHSNEGAAYDAAWRKAEALFNNGRLAEVADPFMEEMQREESREVERQAERRRKRVALLEAAVDFDTRALNTDAIPQKLRLLAAENGITGPDALGWFLYDRAKERYEHGRDRGDNAALLMAIATWRATLEELTRNRVPLDWAMAQNALGTALSALGERENGRARLKEAVAAHRTALKERIRERVPLDWAQTQNNLGVALSALGERESGTARLEEAVSAISAALEERTRDRVPLDWAQTQHNLGLVLQTLGERESGTARLKEAIVAYRAALVERTRDHTPLDWAMTQNNLGLALHILGEREASNARLEEAVTAYHAALQEFTRDRVPLNWSMTLNNLGIALSILGIRESSTARLSDAVAAYRAALEEYTRDRVPRAWAKTQNNLGIALRNLGQRESGTTRLEEAVTAFRSALAERTRDGVKLDWAQTQYNLANALALLAERAQDRALLVDALRRLCDAAEVYRGVRNSHVLPIVRQRIAVVETTLAAWPAP